MTNMIKTQQGLSSSYLRIEQESNMVMMQKNQGIVTILGSNCGDINTPSEHSSLRRTLSADMSSHKWLSHETIKKVPSSDQLMQQSSSLSSKTIADSLSSSSSSSSEDEGEAERERLEIWSSIQRNKKAEQEKAGAGAFDMWNSLMSLKDNNDISKSLPASPYIHPLVKRKKSCLSEKSLEICTESLGSETGSDGLFSSHPSSQKEGDKEEEEEEHQQQQQEQVEVEEEEEEEEEEEKVVIEQEPKYNYGGGGGATKKYSPSRSFPPPLPSLGPSLHMRTHRDNGRLVLEAVSAPSNNNFCVQRQDGRLVLTFAAAADDDDEVAEENDDGIAVEELEEEFEGFEEVHDEAEDESDETEEVEDVKDIESIVTEKEYFLSSEITTNGVHRLAMVMNKAIGLVNRNPKWSEKLNELDVNVVKEMETNPVAKSLPPRPRVTRLVPSTNFNAYEYYWKTKPTTAEGVVTTTISNSLPQHKKVNNNSTSKIIFSGDFKKMSNDQRQQLMVVRVKNGDYKLVHNLDQSCKDSRRSFLFWKPYCIATS